jgi:hypothetical protein
MTNTGLPGEKPIGPKLRQRAKIAAECRAGEEVVCGGGETSNQEVGEECIIVRLRERNEVIRRGKRGKENGLRRERCEPDNRYFRPSPFLTILKTEIT